MLTVGVDGSALGNPGPAGWAWYIDDANWEAGGWDNSTNNRGELSAVLKILKATRHTTYDLNILADSQYVINSITKWMPGWKRKGWKKSDGKPVNNKDLMVELDGLMTAAQTAGRHVSFQWVKGHAGHPLNEAADARANAAAKAFQAGKTPDTGPGLNLDAKTEKLVDSSAVTPTTLPAGPTSAPETITVHTSLNKALADRIVQHAQQRGVSPHYELAVLIQAGMDAIYGTNE